MIIISLFLIAFVETKETHIDDCCVKHAIKPEHRMSILAEFLGILVYSCMACLPFKNLKSAALLHFVTQLKVSDLNTLVAS